MFHQNSKSSFDTKQKSWYYCLKRQIRASHIKIIFFLFSFRETHTRSPEKKKTKNQINGFWLNEIWNNGSYIMSFGTELVYFRFVSFRSVIVYIWSMCVCIYFRDFSFRTLHLLHTYRLMLLTLQYFSHWLSFTSTRPVIMLLYFRNRNGQFHGYNYCCCLSLLFGV